MKKNSLLLSVLFLLIFVFSACSSAEDPNNIVEISDSGVIGNLENFGQPERLAEIDGVVKFIIANQIVVAIVEKQAWENAATEEIENTVTAIRVTPPNVPGSGMGGGGNRDALVSGADRFTKLLERSTG
jgi:hypothetical protein